MKAIYAGVLQAFLHYNVSSRRVYSALQGSIIFLMYWLNLVLLLLLSGNLLCFGSANTFATFISSLIFGDELLIVSMDLLCCVNDW